MVYIIKTKVPGFNGNRAGVMFKNGEAMVSDPYLVDWFRSHGYIVEQDNMTPRSDISLRPRRRIRTETKE